MMRQFGIVVALLLMLLSSDAQAGEGSGFT